MSGAITVTEFVATLGLKMREGEWAHAESALHLLKECWEATIKPAEMALEAIKETAEAGAAAARLALELGIATDALQELTGAGNLAHVSSETLIAGLVRLARTASEAAGGSKAAAEALSGIKLRDAAGQLRPVDELFSDLADKVHKLSSGTEQMALVLKVLGRGSRELVLMLKGGSAALNEMRREVAESGAVLGEAAVEAGENYEHATKRLGMFMVGLRNIFAAPETVDALTEIQTALGDVAKSEAVRSAFEALGHVVAVALRWVAQLVRAFAEWLKEHPEVGVSLLITAAEALGTAVAFLAANALPALLGAVWAFGPAFAAAVAGFTAFYMIADDIRAYSQGADSVIGRVKKWLETPVEGPEGSLVNVLRTLYKALTGGLPSDSWIYQIGPLLDPIFALVTALPEALELVRSFKVGEAATSANDRGIEAMQSIREALGLGRAEHIPGYPFPASGGGAAGGNTATPAGGAPVVTTTIHVNVGAGTDAAGVGDAVAQAFSNFWDSKIREEYVTALGAP